MPELELEDDIKKIQLHHVGGQYMVSYADRNFQVKPFLFNIISEMQIHGVNQIWTRIESNTGLYESDKKIIKSQIMDQINTIFAQHEKKSYINWSFPLLNREKVNSIASLMTLVFNKYIAIFFISLAILLMAFFFSRTDFQISKSMLHLSLQDTIFVYFFTIIILLFHEFGHATAAKFYRTSPREIGVGFYMGIPVFFANVSDIWRLERLERIVINLGGVYFQLIISIVLYVLIIWGPTEITPMLDKIYKINMFIAAYVLIPFIRNDGYWVFSDYFNIPNLNEKSYTAPYRFIRKLIKKTEFREYRPALMFYSIGNYIFLIYFLYAFLTVAPRIVWFASIEITNKGLLNILIKNFSLLISASVSLVGLYLLSRALFKKLALIAQTVNKNGI